MAPSEQEHPIVEALIALDWHMDPIARARAKIVEVLGIAESEALAVLQGLMRRGVVELRAEKVGIGQVMRSKWFRPQEPTS
jgi:hypothetical protein